MKKIYNEGRLYAAFKVGQYSVWRDNWVELARERKHPESRRLCVYNAREANREIVRALRLIRPL